MPASTASKNDRLRLVDPLLVDQASGALRGCLAGCKLALTTAEWLRPGDYLWDMQSRTFALVVATRDQDSGPKRTQWVALQGDTTIRELKPRSASPHVILRGER